MQDYQRGFIEFALHHGVLRFGDFTLKSGRRSPYFFNTGLFHDGASLARLGRYYAQAIVASGLPFDMLFGPAYKGIPLGTAIAIALADHHQRNVPFTFDRKEAKDHGEGGVTVGAPLQGRVLIVDDVISAGTSVRESTTLIDMAGADGAGVAIAVDRQERGTGELSAVQQVERDLGLRVINIVNLDDLVAYLQEQDDNDGYLQRITAYREQYGVSPTA